MCIVTISRQSYTPAKQIAERVAEQLGCECISREILLEASEEFNVPEIKLLRAIRDAPSVLNRFTFGKERYTAFIRAALLDRLRRDNVVYHGMVGHYLVTGITHALKVRIIGKREDRVKVVTERVRVFEQAAWAMEGISKQGAGPLEKHRGMSEEKALRILEDVDEARRRWGLHLYGVDPDDPSLYDLVIGLDRLAIDDAIDMVCGAARLDRFKTTAESQQTMEDLFLAARVKANLISRFPRVNVAAKTGAVGIALEGGGAADERAIRDAVEEIPGVKHIDVNVYPFMTPD